MWGSVLGVGGSVERFVEKRKGVGKDKGRCGECGRAFGVS